MALIRPDEYGYGSWNETNVGTNSGVTVTHTRSTGSTRCFATAIQCSGDAAGIVTIESPVGTVKYRKRFAAAFNMSESFPSPIRGTNTSDISVKISASTSNCEANISGYDT